MIEGGGDPPLAVLHVLWDGRTGGAQRSVYQLVRQQLRDPALAPAVAFAQDDGPYWQLMNDLDCPVLALGVQSGLDLAHLPHVVQKIRPYTVHHFHIAEPLLMLASMLCRDKRRLYTHRSGITEYPLKKRLRYALIGLLSRGWFQTVSANTAHAAECASRFLKLDRNRIAVTYNGVEFEILEARRSHEEVRAELDLDSEHFLLGTAAALLSSKRLDRLLHALDDPRVRLLVLGEGPDLPRLERIATELGVADKVIFAGVKHHIGDYLQTMDAFCLPSTESFGNAAVEAMAMGVPTTVFADGGGLLEHIEPEVTGFVVTVPGQLASVLRRLADDPSFARQVGDRGRAAVRQRYALDQAAEAYRRLYGPAPPARRSTVGVRCRRSHGMRRR